ncbi:MAG: glycosyltransferase family 2 protein [Flavipsychrobacter sp.]|nr:glycosyltransferase family 2 protein [Flavipsychrobacter sp.]
MSVSIVLPCYNPPQGWAENIVHQYGVLSASLQQPLEVIIVYDGISKEVKGTDLVFLHDNIPGVQQISLEHNKGKGHALRTGIAQANGDIIIYTDIDFPYTNESLHKICSALQDNMCDIAVGVKDAVYYEKVPRLRRIISKFLQFFIRLFLSIPITDTQCGLKGFKADIKPVFLATTINRYLFDLEFIRNASKSGRYRISAIPVSLNPGVHFRPMNYKVLLPEIINFIKILLR